MPDFEIRQHDRIADRHAGQEILFGKRTHEVDARRKVARVRPQQLAQALVGGHHQRRSIVLCADRAHPVVKRCIHVGMVEQRRDIGVSRLVGHDLVRVNAAEDQQVMVVRQVLQRLNGRSDTLVFVEKAKNPDQDRVGWQLGEHRKAAPRGAAADGLGLGSPEKGQRVVENLLDAIEVPCVVEISTVVNDRAHLLLALCPAQLAGYSVGQETRSAEVG